MTIPPPGSPSRYQQPSRAPWERGQAFFRLTGPQGAGF